MTDEIDLPDNFNMDNPKEVLKDVFILGALGFIVNRAKAWIEE